MYQLTALQTATLRLTNSISRSPLWRVFFLIPVALALFALAPASRAVSPAPDGGYPGINTAEGTNALQFLTTGTQNTALGGFSLASDNTGNNNTAVGAGALFKDKANDNTATGAGALFNNTLGTQNTANGVGALFTNMLGTHNTANGFVALFNNTADDNTATGWAALAANTIGGHNTANGSGALNSNTQGGDNTAVGFQALASNTASNNTAMGAGALHLSQAGGNNTAIGFNALGSEVTGISNVAVGSGALANAIHGFNIAVGADAGSGVTTALGVIAIGSTGANVGGSCFIGNIRGVMTANANAQTVVIDSAGQLGTISSSRRFKKEIKPMDKTSEAILGLKPVTFHYKSDTTGTPQFGLIAEEVAEVNPDLVVRDDKGEIYSVRYDAVNAMLLNEFLKEHRRVTEQNRKIHEQESTITQLRGEMHAVVARLKEQDSKIQKVSDQLEVSKPATAVVVNE